MSLIDLKECFMPSNIGMSSSGAFLKFLSKSNHPIIKEERSKKDHSVISKCKEIEKEVLKSILDILLVDPEADYFWYNWEGELTYSLPHHEVVPSDALMLDKEKIKSFLRNYKIDNILDN